MSEALTAPTKSTVDREVRKALRKARAEQNNGDNLVVFRLRIRP